MKGYRTKQVLQFLNGVGLNGGDVTQNQLIHWAEKGILKPSIQDADGHGSSREYNFRDIVKAGIISHMLSIGMTIREISLIIESFDGPWYIGPLAVEEAKKPSFWAALKEDPDELRYFFEIRYWSPPRLIGDFVIRGTTRTIEAMCDDLGLKMETVTASLRTIRMINIHKILEVLMERTGERL